MQDSEFAAKVRQITGKETNSEALRLLQGGALGVGPELGAVEPAAEAEAESGTKVDPSKFAE